MARGYTGVEDEFHSSLACPRLADPVRATTTTKALKWNIALCPRCYPDDR